MVLPRLIPKTWLGPRRVQAAPGNHRHIVGTIREGYISEPLFQGEAPVNDEELIAVLEKYGLDPSAYVPGSGGGGTPGESPALNRVTIELDSPVVLHNDDITNPLTDFSVLEDETTTDWFTLNTVDGWVEFSESGLYHIGLGANLVLEQEDGIWHSQGFGYGPLAGYNRYELINTNIENNHPAAGFPWTFETMWYVASSGPYSPSPDPDTWQFDLKALKGSGANDMELGSCTIVISKLGFLPDGEPGDPGTDGDDGAPGSVWHNGAGVPSDALGIDGDYYLNTTNGDVYVKVGGTWA